MGASAQIRDGGRPPKAGNIKHGNYFGRSFEYSNGARVSRKGTGIAAVKPLSPPLPPLV